MMDDMGVCIRDFDKLNLVIVVWDSSQFLVMTKLAQKLLLMWSKVTQK